MKPGVDIRAVIPPSRPRPLDPDHLPGRRPGAVRRRDLRGYVNPADATVLGTVDDAATFMTMIRKIHGELMAGVVGDRIVETAPAGR